MAKQSVANIRPAVAVFVVNLLQDVNVLRPLVYLAARNLGLHCILLVTHLFRQRDTTGLWQQELTELSLDNWASIHDFSDLPVALRVLDGLTGFLVAGSESDLPAHKPVHDLFRAAPPGLRKITLQHGFECVGFLQSRDQDLAHGTTVGFAAEIICGWAEPGRLKSVAPSQRHKLFVSGPSFLLHPPSVAEPRISPKAGLVCENMHSPRLNVAGNFKQDFFEVFTEFAKTLEESGEKIALRPHPGGQYVLKQGLDLPGNVVLSNKPIYRTDLKQFAFGISAPSSVLLDMVLAGIPTAVWQDDSGVMDLGNYEGLTRVSSLADWLEFRARALTDPEPFRQQQARFLSEQGLVTERQKVAKNFCELFRGSGLTQWSQRHREPGTERILIVANSNVATLQLSFLKPLQAQIEAGACTLDLLTEAQIVELTQPADGAERLRAAVVGMSPTIVVFCRYSGPHARVLLDAAQSLQTPTIYQIDDDLLHVPVELGEKKQAFHAAPARTDTVGLLLSEVSLIYCSTMRLARRLREAGIESPIFEARLYCSGEILRSAQATPTTRIGYMASADHAHNLLPLLPALVATLRRHQQVTFEFFGSIPCPQELLEFGERITHAPKINSYAEFLGKFCERQWDVGICPLTPIPFNLMKANTKWVEYTSVGAAVIASGGTVYDDCCSDDCGVLVSSAQEWADALDKLVRDAEYRYRLVENAQRKLWAEYSVERLREQVHEVFAQARNLATVRRARQDNSHKAIEGLDIAARASGTST